MATPPSKFRFPLAPDIPATPRAEMTMMTEVFTDIVNTINERGGQASTHEDPTTGYPAIVAKLTMPQIIGSVAETLFSDKWHERLSPELRRNIIYNLTHSYTTVDLPKQGETAH